METDFGARSIELAVYRSLSFLHSQREVRSAAKPRRFKGLALDCRLSSSCFSVSYAEVEASPFVPTSIARSLVECPFHFNPAARS